MSQEAIDALRAVFEQFARGDFRAYADLPDDYVLVIAPEMPDAGTYRGAAARRWLQAWVESFERLTVEAVDFIDAGDKVLIDMLQRGWSRDADAPVELRNWSVFTIGGTTLTRTELFLTRDQALEAAGLRE